jgi:hypothetical protein
MRKPSIVVTDVRFGEIPCDPPGTSRTFMTKEL